MDLFVTVRNRCVQLAPDTQVMICGYARAEMKISFDAEWDQFVQRYARFTFLQGGKTVSVDVPFIGEYCALPVISGTDSVSVGFYAGEIRTTVPARIPCLPCITELPAEVYRPRADAARLILAKLAGQEAEPPCNGLYLVTANADYLVTDAGDFLLTKE